MQERFDAQLAHERIGHPAPPSAPSGSGRGGAARRRRALATKLRMWWAIPDHEAYREMVRAIGPDRALRPATAHAYQSLVTDVPVDPDYAAAGASRGLWPTPPVSEQEYTITIFDCPLDDLVEEKRMVWFRPFGSHARL